ncbi:MAG: response regulator transcription factor [Treponema sp.]|jgi:DNA-binding NarL/FixJ family response regulator|nr:response regulator transcription factor [Treponema sp.]
MPEAMLKILLADDQSLFAESLRTFLNNYAGDMNVAGIAKNGKEAVSMAGEHRPDIILMDIRMPEMDGVEAVRQIRRDYPEIKIIMLSTYHEDELVRSALLAGASGYLLKDISPTELIAAIRALKSGIVQISPEIARALVAERYRGEFHGGHTREEGRSEFGGRETSSGPGRQEAEQSGGKDSPFEWLNDLTPREREIFTLIATGYDNEQIASTLSLAVQTVRNQVSTIYSKLGVKDRFEIIQLANKK